MFTSSTEASPREGAIRFLYGEVSIAQTPEEVPCLACKETLAEGVQAVFVNPKGEGKQIGPFCGLMCKVRHDMIALGHVLRENEN